MLGPGFTLWCHEYEATPRGSGLLFGSRWSGFHLLVVRSSPASVKLVGVADALTSHWARSTWAPGERRLHWYVLPPEDLRQAVDRTQHAVSRPELTGVPGRWLHCTIIAMRDSEMLSTSDRQTILRAGMEAVADIAAFDAPVGVPAVWGEAVVFDLSPCAGLELLHRRLTHIVEQYLRGPKPTRFIPHITFAYCHDAGDSESTTTTLRDPDLQIPSFRVERVWLLDVLQEPGPRSVGIRGMLLARSNSQIDSCSFRRDQGERGRSDKPAPIRRAYPSAIH